MRAVLWHEKMNRMDFSGNRCTTKNIESPLRHTSRMVRHCVGVPKAAYKAWTPRAETAFTLLVLVRGASALINIITDCDETFNYWEPMHFLLYRFGFQTWEYSPVYALRSYVYVLAHASLLDASYGVWRMAAYVHEMLGISIFSSSKVIQFYTMRALLAIVCARAEAALYRSSIAIIGPQAAQILLILLFCNAGMFQASTAFLPSSFVMYCVMVWMHFWIQNEHTKALACAIIAVLCGWPYVGVLFLMFAFDMVRFRGFWYSIFAGGVIGILVTVAEVAVNYVYYHKLVFPAWNLFQYNVLSKQVDSTLYGVEPWTFYAQNLVLNFNIMVVFAVFAVLPLGLVAWKSDFHRFKTECNRILLPMYIWLGIMFAQPHKEERFLYPIYPLICMAAAMSLNACGRLLDFRLWSSNVRFGRVVVLGSLMMYSTLSLSRIASNYINYNAPLRVYQHLHDFILPNEMTQALYESPTAPLILCLSKEWYRFPTSFFLPTNATRVEFLPSAFHGQLPKHFEEHVNGTSVIPSHMNNRNQEETSRYVSEDQCDFIVDLIPANERKSFEKRDTWQVIYELPFLDSEASLSPYRSFYIPFVSPKYTKFSSYALLKRLKKPGK